MRHQGRRAQGQLLDFIEQELGWDVAEVHLGEEDGFRDDPPRLTLEVVAELELDDESDFRYDPDRDEVQTR